MSEAKEPTALQNTVLELGTAIYTLKEEIARIQALQSRGLKVILGLREILDQKGVVTREEFDLAVEAVGIDEARPQQDATPRGRRAKSSVH